MFSSMFGNENNMPPVRKPYEGQKKTGYNLGLNKGSFATVFDHKEYFEKNIKAHNKKIFEPGISANRISRNSATFITHQQKENENFDDKVQRYIENMEKEDREQEERQRREQ